MLNKFNNVKRRFLPLPESSLQGLENEPNITDFEIKKELGSDEYGNIYLVKHKETHAEYAIKAIDKRDKENDIERPHFKKGFEALYNIRHPNIVNLLGHFEDNNYCYIIMEYLKKGNLYNIFPPDKKKRIKLNICALIIKNVISAVYFLHNMNPPIIHLNIKPENVLLAEELVAKLGDFAWNTYIQEDETRKAIRSTPSDIPPEILLEKKYDESSDIWYIGTLLFELVTATVPFIGDNSDIIKDNILNLKFNWPKDINNDAKDLIQKILKLNPKERLSLEDMLKHPFITQYFPDAEKCLIKPGEGVKYKPFIISKDDPKSWKPEKI